MDTVGDDWLVRANPADIDALAHALGQGLLTIPRDSVVALQSVGIGDTTAVMAFLAQHPYGNREPWRGAFDGWQRSVGRHHDLALHQK